MNAHRNSSSFFKAPLALSALVAFASVAQADMNDAQSAKSSIQQQIEELKAKVAALEKEVEPLNQAAPTAASAAANADKGFALVSTDNQNSVRLRGLLQVDSRWFFDKTLDNDAILIRRARLGLEGKFAETTQYQLIGEFAGTSATILDANIITTYSKELKLELGRFKTPIGLEQLQGDSSNLFFMERSVVSQLIPNRDVGVQVGGKFFDGRITYALGVFDGTIDGGNNTTQTDNNDSKDVAGRLIFSPWINDKESFFQGLSFGFGGSTGVQDASSPLTSGYKSDGQQTIFAYNSGTVANGRVARLSPQLSYYRGPLGIFAEYVTSTAAVQRAGNVGQLSHHAWQVEGGYVLTGEKANYDGIVPQTEFDRAKGTYGAVEAVARISSIKFDSASFINGTTTGFANPTTSVRSADTLGLGVNWYLNRFYRFSLDYEYTRFNLNPGATAVSNSVISHPEHVILTRYQFSF
jgi:phosphate-selective porin OprO/OprP